MVNEQRSVYKSAKGCQRHTIYGFRTQPEWWYELKNHINDVFLSYSSKCVPPPRQFQIIKKKVAKREQNDEKHVIAAQGMQSV